jgi:hypothetical protein
MTQFLQPIATESNLSEVSQSEEVKAVYGRLHTVLLQARILSVTE